MVEDIADGATVEGEGPVVTHTEIVLGDTEREDCNRGLVYLLVVLFLLLLSASLGILRLL